MPKASPAKTRPPRRPRWGRLSRTEPRLDWAAIVAAVPEPDTAHGEPALSLAEIQALSPEQRLALFA
ncbi:hypothetical protein ACRAWG_29675 [Methylobacterium sp. P31]